jgi:lysophospholipase L1-like esterase
MTTTAPTPRVPAPPARRRPKWRDPRFLGKVLLVNVVTLSLTLVVCELGVRILREGGVVAGLRSLVDDRPMPRQLGTGTWLVSDPDRGYTLRAGVNGVNELHVRHAPIATPKPDGTFRLLLLGDSVAWPEDGFAAIVARALTRDANASPVVELINASVPGYTTFQESRHLDRLCAPIDPDTVVLQYCLNDNHRFLHQLTADGGWLITEEARRALLPEGDGLATRILRWSYLALEVRQRLFVASRNATRPFEWQADPAFAAAWRDDSWPLVTTEIDHMAALVRGRGARFCVVAVPYGPQLQPDALQRDEAYTLKPQRLLAELCRARSILLLDLEPEFAAHRDDGLFVDGIHLTERGHALAAAQLEQFLRTNGLVP